MEEFSNRADPAMVDTLITGMGAGIRKAIIPGVTTQADILSAVFTVLHRMLQSSQELEDPSSHDRNAREISRVLMEFLVEFGTSNQVN